jgi:hypothetical protein
MAEAEVRYGAEANAIIKTTTAKIVSDPKIPDAVKVSLSRSKVLVDLMYVMGQSPDELERFIDIARRDPIAAVEEIGVLKRLVMEELSKATPKAKAEATEEKPAGESKGPKDKPTFEPPEEVGGNKGKPADPAEIAAESNDFSRYRSEKNRQYLARMRGN